MKKIALIALLSLLFLTDVSAQQPDRIMMPNIHTVKLFVAGKQDVYPIIPLNVTNALELHFDDLDANIKNYNYTYVLCDADWTPVDLSPFDYLQGFTQGRLSQYRNSSVAETKYTHYQMFLPEQ